MDIFDTPKPKRQKKPFSLAALAKRPPQDSALVKQIKGALEPETVKALEAHYNALEAPIRKETYWERVGRVAGWRELPEAIAARDQFGEQEARPKMDRHKARWRRFTGDLVGLVGYLASWQHEHKGGYRGWFPVPGEREWDEAALWLAGGLGVYLYRVDLRDRGHVVADGGLCVEVQGDDASCLMDP